MASTLISIEDFAALRGVEPDPTDVSVLVALEGASGLVRRYTGRGFEFIEDDEVVLDGTGTKSLLLPETPVLEVGPVSTLDDAGTETTVEGTGYRLDAAGILWQLDGAVWPEGKGNVLVTYSHGYVLPGQEGLGPLLPSDLQLVTGQVASRILSRGMTGAGGIRSESVGSYSVAYFGGDEDGSGLTVLERSVLDTYRLSRLA